MFTSPYGQDQLWLLEIEIEKQAMLEKKKKKTKGKSKKWQAGPKENINDELKQMAFLVGIYGGENAQMQRDYLKKDEYGRGWDRLRPHISQISQRRWHKNRTVGPSNRSKAMHW